jgi:hypothetical protein
MKGPVEAVPLLGGRRPIGAPPILVTAVGTMPGLAACAPPLHGESMSSADEAFVVERRDHETLASATMERASRGNNVLRLRFGLALCLIGASAAAVHAGLWLARRGGMHRR